MEKKNMVTGIFLVCSMAVGITGMYGLYKNRACCLIISALALPALFFTALWFEINLEDISCGFCIIAFLVLSGLWGGRR